MVTFGMKRWAGGLILAGWTALAGSAAAQTHDGVELLRAELIADSAGIVPGRPLTLGLHLKMADGWHTYWENPGDSGLPVTAEWELPEGFRVTDLQWPLPLRLEEPGNIEVYAYKDEVLLLARLFPPRAIDAGEVTLQAGVEWLVCEKICLPGGAEVSLTLPVVETGEPRHEELFARFRERLPQPYRPGADAPFSVGWGRDGADLVLTVSGVTGRHFDFFPLPEGDLAVGHPSVVNGSADGATTIRIPVDGAGAAALDRLDGVVAELDGPKGKPVRGWRLGRGASRR